MFVDVVLVTARSGASVRTRLPRSIGPLIASETPVTPVLAAVVMVASAESATEPEIVAVRFDVLNEPRMAPWVPLPDRPLPPIVKLLASVVAFRRTTEPLPLTITLPVPKALLLKPSAAPSAAVRT